MNVKTLLMLSAIASLITLFSCTKDSSGPSGGGGGTVINYTLSAPPCLLTSISGISGGGKGTITITYDNLKRIISSVMEDQSEVTTYVYQGNSILQTSRSVISGRESIQTQRHTLNSAGFIEHTEQIDTSPNYKSETFYYYSQAGYLLREVQRTTYISFSGTDTSYLYHAYSYTYENGNQTKRYNVNMNGTGIATDSTVATTYTYYSNMPAKLQLWISWNERKGRPNANEIKTEYYDVNRVTTITYDQGTGGFPSGYHFSDGNNKGDFILTWLCQ